MSSRRTIWIRLLRCITRTSDTMPRAMAASIPPIQREVPGPGAPGVGTAITYTMEDRPNRSDPRGGTGPNPYDGGAGGEIDDYYYSAYQGTDAVAGFTQHYAGSCGQDDPTYDSSDGIPVSSGEELGTGTYWTSSDPGDGSDAVTVNQAFVSGMENGTGGFDSLLGVFAGGSVVLGMSGPAAGYLGTLLPSSANAIVLGSEGYANIAGIVGADSLNVAPDVWAAMDLAEQQNMMASFINGARQVGQQIVFANDPSLAAAGSGLAFEYTYITQTLGLNVVASGTSWIVAH